MFVISVLCCAIYQCAGFELDLKTKNSRSQTFFFNNSYRPKVDQTAIKLSLLEGGGGLATRDIWPRNHRSLLCYFSWVIINLHSLTGHRSNYMKLLFVTHEGRICILVGNLNKTG